MIQKIFVSRAFCVICILLILANLSGCYSTYLIDSKGTIEKEKVGRVVLKDNSELIFYDETNRLLDLTKEVLIYKDSKGIENRIPISDIEKFYEYKIDGVKILLGTTITLFVTFYFLVSNGLLHGPGG